LALDTTQSNAYTLRNINVNGNINKKRKETVMSRIAQALTVAPRLVRPAPEPLGLYFRVGRNDHRELLEVVASGETRFFGLVFDPTYARFQKELVDRAIERRLDVILDPRTQASATIGGFNSALGDLPWGRGRSHIVEDFTGIPGRRLMTSLATFAVEHGYSQLLTPSHVLRSTDEPWWDVDRANARHLRDELERVGHPRASMLYSLAISYAMLRNSAERRALLRGLKGLPIDAIWLAVDGIGSDSTPTAVRTYLEALSEFHELGLPVVADHIGGTVGLALLAFGGVGAMAHGLTMGERFDTTHWWRPRSEESFGLPRRVYIPTLDLLLKPAEARALFDFGTRVKGLFGCRDTRCCPRGIVDMLENPGQHFLRQRIEEVSKLGTIPASLRASRFVDQRLRSTTDAVLSAANLNWADEALGNRMRRKRKRMDRMRITLADLVESGVQRSVSAVPRRRIVRIAAERAPLSP